MSPNDPTLALEALQVSFTHPGAAEPAVDALTLRIHAGSCTGLLGPNGAGKTTFVNLVCGLLRPAAGELFVFGEESGTRAALRTLGACPQELALVPTLTARENLFLFGRLARAWGKRLAARVDECLAIASLTSVAATRVERFSGGMKRRLNLAAALMHEPRLLLLDEPTAGVDTQSRNAIFEALAELVAAGTTLLYTTHYMEEVERLCEDVVVIDRGRILAAGPTRELVAGGRRAQTYRIGLTPGRSARAIAADVAAQGIEVHVRGELELELAGDDLARLTAELARLARDGALASVETHRPTLEERFLQLTGKGLRDA